MSERLPNAPHEYPRRILLTLCGLTPQVVTETVFALVVDSCPSFVPTEIRLITTKKGAQKAVSSLLEGERWFHRLCEAYQIPEIRFSEDSIETLVAPDGTFLDDIRSHEDNETTANQIMERIRRFTNNADSAVHVSMAGGRKTMGFFAGYALSLYGRKQDRLSHVLVSAPFESHPDFFYPTPYSHLIPGSGDSACTLDTKDAEVTLANIDFVRLRGELPQSILDGNSIWGETITKAQKAIGSAVLTIDLDGKKIKAGHKTLKLPPVQLAFLAWLAHRRSEDRNWVSCPNEGAPELEHSNEFLSFYRIIIGTMGSAERTLHRLQHGMTQEFFSQTKSKLIRNLRKNLGNLYAEPYSVKDDILERRKVFGLTLKPGNIRFEAIDCE